MAQIVPHPTDKFADVGNHPAPTVDTPNGFNLVGEMA